MTTTPDADRFLLGGGGKSAKFDTIGATITGTIHAKPEVKQQTKMGSGELDFWDNGDPKLQLVVTLATDQRDPDDGDDDGMRNLYVKGSQDPKSKSLHAAVAAAVTASGAKGLEVGGKLTVTYVANGVSKTAGFNPPKQYEATYIPAAAGFLGTGDAAPAATQPAIPAQQAGSTGPTPVDTARQLIAVGGLDDVQIGQATGLAPAIVASLRNLAVV